MSTVQSRVDPVTAAVIAGALDSIAVEMGHKLARMSFSSIIRESEDFGCVICDDQARQLCESSQSTPLQSGPIPGYIRGINRRFAELGAEWKPGDVVIHNHAYYGASHQPDVGFCVPIFHRGELVGFSATTAHHLDLGALDARHMRDRRRHRRLRRGPSVRRDQGRGGGSAQRLGLAAHPRQRRAPNTWSWATWARRLLRPRRVRLGSSNWSQRYGLQTVRDASEDLMDYSDRDAAPRDRAPARTAPIAAEGHLDGFVDDPDPAPPGSAHPGRRDDRRLRDPRRPQRDLAADRPPDQHALRGHRRHRGVDDAALDPAGLRDPRPGAHELRPVPGDLDHRPRGLPGQPPLPGADDRPLLRRQPRRRHADAGARADRSRTGSAPGWATSR